MKHIRFEPVGHIVNVEWAHFIFFPYNIENFVQMIETLMAGISLNHITTKLHEFNSGMYSHKLRHMMIEDEGLQYCMGR